MVFFHHYEQLPWGWSGVDLFFVLSGFLITGILFDACNDRRRFRNFYLRRTLRIFPLYYGVMVALVLTYPVLHWQWSWTWLAWPAYIGNFARFLHPYLDASPLQRLADFQPIGTLHGLHVPLALGHFWSLCVEEQFYLIWPCVVFVVRSRTKLIWICALSLPICLGMRLWGQLYLPTWMLDDGVLNRATPFRFDALLIGGLMALLLRGPRADLMLRAASRALPIALLLTLACVVFIPAGHIFRKPYPYPDWTFTFGLSALDVLGALLILSAIQPGSWLSRILSPYPLRWLGRISYGAYVLHDIPHPIFNWLGERLVPAHASEVSALLAMLFTLSFAWLSFRYFESRFLALKDRLTGRGAA
jgi:peptidoglycan/LPS O-acetylase OafA/YrhL